MKKLIIVITSICCFFLVVFFTVHILVESGLTNNINETNKSLEYEQLFKEIRKLPEFDKFEKEKVSDFLNRDNLYENYTQNYVIKVPENYEQNDGIGEFASAQFYSQELGFVLAVNVVQSNLNKKIYQLEDNILIKHLSNFLINDAYFKKLYENKLAERGYNDPVYINSKLTNYNNREFIKINFKANRILDNEKYPILITIFVTHYNKLFYNFQFVSYQFESFEKWNFEIQSSMNNVLINQYIKKRD